MVNKDKIEEYVNTEAPITTDNVDNVDNVDNGVDTNEEVGVDSLTEYKNDEVVTKPIDNVFGDESCTATYVFEDDSKRLKFNDIVIPDTVLASEVNGVNYIDLGQPDTPLGKILSPFKQSKFPIELLSVKIYNIGKFLNYLAYDNFPIENFTIPSWNKKDAPVAAKGAPRVLDNYWGIVATCLIIKVQKDKELHKLLKENALPFNILENKVKESSLFGKSTIKLKSKMRRFHGYIKAVRYVEHLVKNFDINNDEVISAELEKDFPGVGDSVTAIVEEIMTKSKQ